MVSEMTQVLIEGRCTIEHANHLITRVLIENRNGVSLSRTRHKYALTLVTEEVLNVDSG